MDLILSGINGNFLRSVLINALDTTQRVDAAVAYATRGDLLFDWCKNNHIPLRFWGRFDDGVPIALPILRQFLHDRSGIYDCRLVRHLHAKVIWWRGYGVYIGSANLTQLAWWSNIEAGTFLTENEVIESGRAEELNDFFRIVDQHSSPLTDEILRALERRQRELIEASKKDSKNAEKSEENLNVVRWSGLASDSGDVGEDRRKAAFIGEWNSTLQTMRRIADIVADHYRPAWVNEGVPKGAQVDQFLHAHYYQRTFEGGRGMYESQFQKHRLNPEAALLEAMEWWRMLPAAPGSEDDTLNVQAPILAQLLSREGIERMRQQDLRDVFLHVNAALDYARRVPNAQVNLPGNRTYTREEKTEALASSVWNSRSGGDKSVIDTIRFVLYDGPLDELPLRLWEATTDSKYRIAKVGISTLGEMVGWAMPNRFPPRNGRTSKALRSLGYDVRVHAGESADSE